MRTTWGLVVGVVVGSLAACCSCGGGGGSTAGGTGSGPGGNNGGDPCNATLKWNIVSLDGNPDAGGPLDDLDIAVSPSDVVGVGYLNDALAQSDAGFELFNVKYAQYATATSTVTPPAIVDTVQNTFGVSVAIQPSGNPAVAYLGGLPYGGNGAGASKAWLNSAAVVATESGGTWTPQIVDDGTKDPNGPTFMGTAATCGPPCTVTNNQCSCQSTYLAMGPSVVGLYSALGFDGSGNMYDYFRDIGFGECDSSAVGNCGASRIDGEVGPVASPTMEWAFLGDTWSFDGQPVHGLGGHMHLVMAGDQPALVTDEWGSTPGGESGGANVDFIMRLGTNNWSVPVRIIKNIGDTGTGPALTYLQGYGYAAVVYDEASNDQKLYFTSSNDGITWANQDDLFAGSGGWNPSVAINPTTQQPVIADFFCSNEPGVSDLVSCPKNQRQVEIRQLEGASWCGAQQVDPAGGYQPKIAFLSTGKMVVAYRQLTTSGTIGPLVLAVEQ